MADKYETPEELGKGAFGKVYKARRKSDNKIIALKLLDIPNKKVLHEIKEEIASLEIISDTDCPNPYVVCYYDSFYNPEYKIYIIEMEFIEGVDMKQKFDRLRGKVPINYLYEYILLLTKDIVNGLNYIHKKGVIHNDIKLENVMITDNNIAKLIDFGFACIIQAAEETCEHAGVTLYYATPEFANGDMMRNASGDMWALGVLLYKAATNAYIYDRVTTWLDLKTLLISKEPNKLNTSNKTLNDVVNGLLKKNPSERLTADQVLMILNAANVPTTDPIKAHNFETMTKGAIIELALSLDLPELLVYCAENNLFNLSVCRNRVFWILKLRDDFGIESDEIYQSTGDIPRKYYEFLNSHRNLSLTEQLEEARKLNYNVLANYLTKRIEMER